MDSSFAGFAGSAVDRLKAKRIYQHFLVAMLWLWVTGWGMCVAVGMLYMCCLLGLSDA
jgi:hypothetical protein